MLMPKKPDIQPDPPEKARARFEKAVDAALKPQVPKGGQGNWAKIKPVEKSRENTK